MMQLGDRETIPRTTEGIGLGLKVYGFEAEAFEFSGRGLGA